MCSKSLRRFCILMTSIFQSFKPQLCAVGRQDTLGVIQGLKFVLKEHTDASFGERRRKTTSLFTLRFPNCTGESKEKGNVPVISLTFELLTLSWVCVPTEA